MKWQWQQNILGNHSEWWDHLRARYLFPLLLFPPLCLLSTQLYTIQMSHQNTIHYRWSTQLYMIQMLRHAPLWNLLPLFAQSLPPFILYPPIMPSPSSFLPLDDENENDNGERPWYDLYKPSPYEKDGDTGSEDDEAKHCHDHRHEVEVRVAHWGRLLKQGLIRFDQMGWVMIITEVDSWNRHWSDLIRFDQMGDDYHPLR